jgi:hypothetical protein
MARKGGVVVVKILTVAIHGSVPLHSAATAHNASTP